MILNSKEKRAINQKLNIKKRFLVTNALLKKELKKIKNNFIKQRIKNDRLRYISIIEYQKIQNDLKRYENRKVSIFKSLRHQSIDVELSIPKKIIIKLFIFQFILLIRWLKDKKRNLKINIFILNAVADDLVNHIYKKKRDHNFEILIPVKLIIFSKKILFKNIEFSNYQEKIEPLN